MNEANTPALEAQDEQTPLEHLVEVHEMVHDKSISRRAHPLYSHGFRNGVERSLAIMQTRDANYTDGPDEHATESQLAERLARLEGIHAMPVVQDGCQSFQNGLERAMSIMQGREPDYSSNTAGAELVAITEKITNIRDIQGAKETIEAGEYMRGMYNGLELALSIVQSRDPEYK